MQPAVSHGTVNANHCFQRTRNSARDCPAPEPEGDNEDMARTAQYDVGDEPISGYKLNEFLGRGAFGEVWKATDPSGKKVAVKIIDLTASTAAQKELRAFNLIKNLDHPHLVPIFTARLKGMNGREIDFDRAEEARSKGDLKALIIAMGLAQKSLSGRLKEFNREGTPLLKRVGIPVIELIPYMEGAAKGIDFLNQSHNMPGSEGPIVHCDIKPDNMLIVNGEVLIADCGVAVILNTDVRRSMAAGSMAYNPPEQMANNPVKGTDQYALAISYYELRTGRLPFREDVNAYELMAIHAEGRLDFSPLLLAADEQAALKRATNRQVKDRFESCTKFVRALKRSLAVELGDIDAMDAMESRPSGPQVEMPAPAPSSRGPTPPVFRPSKPRLGPPPKSLSFATEPEGLRGTFIPGAEELVIDAFEGTGRVSQGELLDANMFDTDRVPGMAPGSSFDTPNSGAGSKGRVSLGSLDDILLPRPSFAQPPPAPPMPMPSALEARAPRVVEIPQPPPVVVPKVEAPKPPPPAPTV